MSVDTKGAGGTRIIKATQAYGAGDNIPGVLMPYEEAWLDLAGGKATVFIEKNGIPQVTGKQAGADIEIYPGTTVENGDIKTASGLAENDILAITYGPVRYSTI